MVTADIEAIAKAGLAKVRSAFFLGRRSALKGFRRPFGPVKLTAMEVNLRPETESRLQELAQKTGRAPAELVEDAMARLPERTG